MVCVESLTGPVGVGTVPFVTLLLLSLVVDWLSVSEFCIALL